MENHDFFVIIVHYRNESSLAKSVANLKQFIDERFICVVDNSKTLNPEDYSNYICLDNPGFGYGMNVGVEVMQTRYPNVKYGLLMSHETLISEKSVAELLHVVKTKSDIVAVGPILKISEDTYWSFGGDFNRFGLFPKNIKSAHSRDTVDWLDGACTLVELDAFIELGGYPEEYFMYVEDVAFGYKVRAAGKKLKLVSEATAYQTPGSGSRFYDIRNQIILSANYRSRTHTLFLISIYSLSILKCITRNDRTKAKETVKAIQSAVSILK